MKYLNGYSWKDLANKQLISKKINMDKNISYKYIGKCKEGKLFWDYDCGEIVWICSMNPTRKIEEYIPLDTIVFLDDIYKYTELPHTKITDEIRRELKWLYIKQQWDDRNSLQL